MREECVEAANRAECFAKMKVRGIVPIGVKEIARSVRSVASPKGGRKTGVHSGKWVSVVTVVVVALLLGGGVWWWWTGNGKSPDSPTEKTEKPAALPKEVKPAAAPKPLPATNEPPKYVPTPLPADWKDMTKAERAEWRREDAIKNPRPPQQAPTTFTASSLRRKKNAPPPIFSNQMHSDLANYITPGHDIPPPSRITDAEALAAADIKIKYYDTDSDAVLEEKRAVEDMLQEMKEYILQGGHADDYFEKLAHRQSMEAEAVSETRRNVRALVKDGKMEEARAALEAYNTYLKGKGIPPVKVKGLK